MSSDPDRWLNALHIPSDAGQHPAEAIELILRRIPDGWGRSLGVDEGWYPLVVATDRHLARLDPNYVVHQIKEKFGTLRYYCEPSRYDANNDVLDAMTAITDGAERASATICERCGEPGVLHRTRRAWLNTLCAACADHLGYTPAQPELP